MYIINYSSYYKCDTIILDDISRSDTIPDNIVCNDSSNINHEATVSKVSKEKLFYLKYTNYSIEEINNINDDFIIPFGYKLFDFTDFKIIDNGIKNLCFEG